MFFSKNKLLQDGTVYIESMSDLVVGYLYAFVPLDPNAPTAPTITGQTKGKIKTTYTYTFTSTSPPGKNISYAVDWGYGTTTEWLGPYNSGTSLTLNHSWGEKGIYTVKARAKDTDNILGPWGTLSVTMPFSHDLPVINFLEKILERFPHTFPILQHLMEWERT